MQRSHVICSAAVGLVALGCSASTPAPRDGIASTHQWTTKTGTSLFVQVSLGTAPATAADAMMSVMPTIVHQLGERCRSNLAAVTPGRFTLSFVLEGGAATNPTSEPPSALAECVVGAMSSVMGQHSAALVDIPASSVVLHLEHAPVAG